jgi:hypothetical protein
MASLFLACKSEEVPKKLRDICNVFYRLDQRREEQPIQPLDIGGKVF